MAIIKIKYKSTTGSVPSGLCAGELAVNLVDRRLWVGGTTTTSIELAGLSANTFGALNSFNSGISANGATFSGTVTAPTQTIGTNNTTVATTAFVIANALTSSSAVTGVNGFTGAVGISGGQGITIDKLAGNPKIIRSSINYNYGGLTFPAYSLPQTIGGGAGLIVKDWMLLQANPSNPFVTTQEEMYLTTIGSFKQWLLGAGPLGVLGLTGTEGIPIFTEYGGETLTNTYIGVTAFQKIILDGGVTSFNGRTGAVTGASLGANTFTELNTFTVGVTAAGITATRAYVGVLTTPQITFGITTSPASLVANVNTRSVDINAGPWSIGNQASNAWDYPFDATVTANPSTGSISFQAGSNFSIGVGGATFNSALDVAGPARMNAGLTASILNVTGIARFASGITVSGRMDAAGVLDVVGGVTFESTSDHAGVARFASGVTASGRVDIGGVLDVVGGVTFESTSDHAGAARFAAGITASAINVTGLAKFNGNVTIGDTSTDVLTVTSGATFGITDHSNPARFASTLTGTTGTFNSSVVSPSLLPTSGGAGLTIGSLSGGGSGNISLVSSTLRVGGTSTLQGFTLSTTTGVTFTVTSGNSMRFFPVGAFTVAPSTPAFSGGTIPSLVVEGKDDGIGQVQITGGDLYLGWKESALEVLSPANIILGNPTNAFTTTLTAPNTATSSKTITLPNTTGTMVVDAAANTFTALQSFTAGISAAGATLSGNVTVGGDVAVNGGDLTTTAATATLFNSGATTLSVGGAATTTNIATVASGLTLNIATGANGSGIKNIYIGSGSVGGGSARTTIGYNGGLIVSHGSGITVGDSSGGYFINLRSATTNVTGTMNASGALNSTGLFTTTGGLSASGGVTFNTPIVSTRLPRTSSGVFDTRTSSFSPAEADNGKVFVINISGKTTITVTLEGLSTGWRAKFLVLGGNGVSFISTTGTVLGTFGVDGAGSSALTEMVEVYCYGSGQYFAG